MLKKSYTRINRPQLLADTNATNLAGSVENTIVSPYQASGGGAYLYNRINTYNNLKLVGRYDDKLGTDIEHAPTWMNRTNIGWNQEPFLQVPYTTNSDGFIEFTIRGVNFVGTNTNLTAYNQTANGTETISGTIDNATTPTKFTYSGTEYDVVNTSGVFTVKSIWADVTYTLQLNGSTTNVTATGNIKVYASKSDSNLCIRSISETLGNWKNNGEAFKNLDLSLPENEGIKYGVSGATKTYIWASSVNCGLENEIALYPIGNYKVHFKCKIRRDTSITNTRVDIGAGGYNTFFYTSRSTDYPVGKWVEIERVVDYTVKSGQNNGLGITMAAWYPPDGEYVWSIADFTCEIYKVIEE